MKHETPNSLRFEVAKARSDFGEVGIMVFLPAESTSEPAGARPTHLKCKVHKEESLQA